MTDNRPPETMAVVTRADGGRGHKRYHILSDRKGMIHRLTACGCVADQQSAIPAREVPLNLRCNRKACRHNYPDFRPGTDRRVFK